MSSNFPLLPKTWFLPLAFHQTSQNHSSHYKELFPNTDDQELIRFCSTPPFSFKRKAVGEVPVVWRAINVSGSFWTLRSQPRLMNWSRCDDLGLKKIFHTRSFWKTQTNPYQRGRSAQLSEQHTYHQSPELFTMLEKHETNSSGAEDTVTFSEQHYKPINILQDFGDLILKVP